MAETEKVALKRAYMWVEPGQKNVTSYGPGEVEIPKAMADGLRRANVLPTEADTPVEPQGIAFLQEAGYDSMTVAEALGYIAGLTETEQAIALEYERQNKNRGTLLTEFD